MARTATLLELRTRAYKRSGNENETGRFPAAEVTVDVNESIAALYDMLVECWGSDRFEASQTISVTSGTSTYALAAAFMDLLAVELIDGGNRFALNKFMRGEKPSLLSTSAVYGPRPTMYSLIGANIELLPTPSAAYTLTVRYVPAATELVSDSDTFDGVNGWEEWVVVDVARKMATKDRDFQLVQVLDADKLRLEERIRARAPQRDRTGKRRIVDVRGYSSVRRRLG